jgi:hypothetical protein
MLRNKINTILHKSELINITGTSTLANPDNSLNKGYDGCPINNGLTEYRLKLAADPRKYNDIAASHFPNAILYILIG